MTAPAPQPGAAPAPAGPGGVRPALLAVQLLFGAHYLAAKWVVAELPPPAWAWLRVAVSAAMLGGALRLTRRAWPARRHLPGLALCALFGVALNQALFLEGIARTTVGHSALINSQIPTFTLLFALLLRQERLTARKAAGFACGVAGVLVLLEADRLRFDAATLSGDLLNLGNAASYALFVVLAKRLLGGIDALAATAAVFAGGALLLTPYGLDDLWRATPAALSARAWAAAAFTIVGATVGTYLLNLWALRRAPASRVALYIFLQPLIAAALGIALLGERLTPRFLLAAALVGAALSLRDSVKKR